jgi:predicted nucleic-acid-binding Zn-ribbon protein
MKTCPHCGSTEIFQKINGIVSGEKKIYVRELSVFTPATDRLVKICANCGYYESYVADVEILKRIKEKWEKV